MNTDDLIETLSRDVPPVRRHALGRRLAVGFIGGGLATILLMVLMLGIRADIHHAMHSFAFWMKWTYTASLGVVALFATTRLARPDGRSLKPLWLILIPILLLAGVGVSELASRPSREWLAMWLGRSWTMCPWLVLTLAMPIFIGLLWSFRRMAPTRLRAAGAAAGLAAGAWAATIYCIHCGEMSAIFVLTWYSLGIVLAAGVGALIGPRLMRW